MDSIPATANSMDIDLDLTESVTDAIYALDVMHGSRAHVAVTAANGHVTLEGVVQSPMAAAEVERAAAETPGVAGMTSHLVDDATLMRRVAEALSKDPRTAGISPGYEVNAVFGHMWLVGKFTAEQSQAVLDVCRAVPGVRTVTIKQI